MWTLYDKLIGEIPREYLVDEAIQGSHWTMVRSGGSVGLAMTLHVETRPWTLPDSLRRVHTSSACGGTKGVYPESNTLQEQHTPSACGGVVDSWTGMPLRDLAVAAKSWNFAEASLGMAAVNAYHNSPERPLVARSLAHGEDIDAFTAYRQRAAGKKAAVIGHFHHLEKNLGDVCELSILEKRPSFGDYPDSACEFLLPLQDYVFATGVTCINKTLPRLLELSRKTGLILAGPSVPMAPFLFAYGISDLQGFVVTDPALCRAVIAGENACACIFDTGKRVSVIPDMI
jgi:uncharacterized protein (DUF4213/DUF364 family)